MTVGQLNLTVFSSALLCFGMVCATPSHAVPQRPWYVTAFDRVLRVVHNEDSAVDPAHKEAPKLAQPYVSLIIKDERLHYHQGTGSFGKRRQKPSGRRRDDFAGRHSQR